MADPLANGLSEDSISEYASSTAGTDPLEDFLDRYTFKVSPECCLKLHKSCGRARLGANCFFKVGGSRRWTFVAKPADKGANPWLHKITGDFDWETRRAGMHWKVSTKWNAGPNKLERKQKLRLADGVELRPHWRMDVYMPEVEGRLGSAARSGEDSVHVERGHCHITIPRLDLVLPLDALARRARQLTAGPRILPDAPGGEPWRRNGGAVGEAVAAPAGEEVSAWNGLLQRLQARLSRIPSDHAARA
ncbi:hypothetical protein WJX81_005477 [Elliptochloris bilobata]|uniref:DUF7781 domain-containing protein n=1 Tax=Elliptochloris bilobata TaxID=381761 RepID=A0AAW1QIJ9_9CHLO